MFKKIVCILIFLLVLISSVPAGDNAEVWSRLYERVESLDQKYVIMQKIVQLDDPSLELMLTKALDELVVGEYYHYSLGEDYLLWEDITRMIIQELGELKAQDAAYLVATVMRDYQGLLKADAMMALGAMQAVEYTAEISTVLRNLNFNLNDDRETAEREAYGAIIGLNRMGQIEGFNSVFFAHIGWCSRRVKRAASNTLQEMVTDPTEEILKIMETGSFEEKIIALEVEAQSQAPQANKIRVAVLAVEMGVSSQGNSVAEKDQLEKLRMQAMKLLVEYEASDDEAVPFLQRAYLEADTDEEKMDAIHALGVNGSDVAVGVLLEFLDFYNERKLGGVNPTNREERVIRQILFAMGISGNRDLVMPALSSLEVYDYSNSINRAARAALEKY